MSAARLLPLADRPRLGCLGLGWIGRNRLQALAQAEVAQIAALADPSAECLAAAHELAPSASTHASFAELLDRDLDGVVIATPSALHAEQAAAALERGVAVFCQKPLGRSAEETRRVIATARRHGRLLGVDYSYRHAVAFARVRELVRQGTLGEVFAAQLTFHNAYGPDKPWFYDLQLSGGGCLIDLGTHLVDFALWTLGWPEVSTIHGKTYRDGRLLPPAARLVEDFASAQLALESGASISLACSWKLPLGADCFIEAAFFGSRGSAMVRNVQGSFYDFTAEHCVGRERTLLCGPKDPWGGRALTAWAERLARDHSFDPEVETTTRVAHILDSIYGRAP